MRGHQNPVEKPTIYLDSAATTLQKPSGVSRAVAYAMGHCASVGRGGHPTAMLAANTVFQCREAVAELFHVPKVEQVIFTQNATHGLNMAIKTLVHTGDTVLISGYEHNAVTRPLRKLNATIKVAQSPLFRPDMMYQRFEQLLTPDVTCVICNHISNVFGYVLPLEEISALCHTRQVPLIVDASQSAGVKSIDVQQLQAAFVAMPGHKGLYGPQGTGILLCNQIPNSLMEGGTGSDSAELEMPSYLPDCAEVGTHNVCGIAGLLAGVRYVTKRGVVSIAHHEKELIKKAAEELTVMGNVWVYYDHTQIYQSGVLSFVVKGMDCEEVGHLLGEQGIAVRAGLHCAPLAHRTVGTMEGGTVRMSVSTFNTTREIEQFLRVLFRMTQR